MAIVGYTRVSSEGQNTARQLDGLNFDKMFTDKVSGKDLQRPALIELLGYVREGDTIVCHSMDRLARSLDDLRKIVLDLTKRGIKVQFVKENLSFTGDDSPMSKLLLNMMGAFGQFERELIHERQLEGVAIAKKAGLYKGRKPSLTPAKADELRARIADGNTDKSKLAREFGISRGTLYLYINKPKA